MENGRFTGHFSQQGRKEVLMKDLGPEIGIPKGALDYEAARHLKCPEEIGEDTLGVYASIVRAGAGRERARVTGLLLK